MVDRVQFKKVWGVGPGVQIFVICALFTATTLLCFKSVNEVGTVWGMPFAVTMLFAPIYEELIFRGWIFGELNKHHSAVKSVALTSLLFGLWHLKNIFYLETHDLMYQMVYAGLILGPILAWIALRSKSVWPGVILHYLNNVGAILFTILLG